MSDPTRALADEVRAMLETHACFQTNPPLIGVIELRRRLAALSTTPAPLDVERLARAIDAHMAAFLEQPESFDNSRAVAENIAREYATP